MRLGALIAASSFTLALACGGSDDATKSSSGGGAAGTAGTATGGAGGGSAGTGGSGATAGTSSGGNAGTSSGGNAGTSSGGNAGTNSGGSAGTGAGGTGGTGTGGTSAGCTNVWNSGFEKGFPGEFLNYDTGAWSANGSMPSGRVSAWTIIDQGSAQPVHGGSKAYKGWIVGAAADSHRAYPVLHTSVETPLVNTFWVYLDVDYAKLSQTDWIHFGTWGNEDGGAGEWALHTMSVRDKKLEFAHTAPFGGTYIGPTPQPDFPLKKWVRFTAYLHYTGSSGKVQVWQDGVAVLKADVAQLATNPGTKVTRAHWGMYASATTAQGTQYNDDITIYRLAAPLTDLVKEPCN